MKTIYILLTRSGTLLSRVVELITGEPYTHASVSFDEGLQPLYSSARKNGETMFPAGPTTEVFHRGFYCRHRNIACALYSLEVEEEAFDTARLRAQTLAACGDDYSFNILGLILCQLGIPFHPRNKFFCSQFVAEVLHGALELPKDTSLMKPMDYTRLPQLRCRFRGRLQELVNIPDYHPKTRCFFGKELLFPLGNSSKLWYTMR